MDTKESLNAIFNPKSVALIGATADRILLGTDIGMSKTVE